MNAFEDVIDKIRGNYPGIFHERALQTDPQKLLPVYDIEIPTDSEIWRDKNEGEIEEESIPLIQDLDDIQFNWNEFEPETDAIEESDEATKQRAPFENRPRQVGIELLAVYKPFHLYPKDAWGVLFFEKSMLNFCNRLMPFFHSFGFNTSTTKKMITYAIARHEFMHFLHELNTLELEMIKGGQVYIPYQNSVYKREYPGPECVEETVATVWQWDNNVMKTPAILRHFWRQVIKRIPAPAYSNAANLDREEIRPIEDKLAAQANQCNPGPKIVPQVWGSLPRPYVQPWTRYENVPWLMTKSAGGVFASQLGGTALRKTMQIYHI